MPEIRPGFSWASLLALSIGIGLIAYLAYSATKKTDSETFTKGASKTEYTISENNIFPRCGRMFDIMSQPDQKKQMVDRK